MNILKIYDEKMLFLDIIFQQDNAPVHQKKWDKPVKPGH